MCITRCRRAGERASRVQDEVGRRQGLCAIELLVGLTLGLMLASALLPLWLSAHRYTDEEVEETIWSAQSRVAAGRLERDLRLATAEGAPFAAAGPVLYASAAQLVLLTRKSDGGGPVIVEWELVGGALMRRWGPCPGTRPTAFPHGLYTDNKTMLDKVVCPRSVFRYRSLDGWIEGPITGERLALVVQVELAVEGQGYDVLDSGPRLLARARVGR